MKKILSFVLYFIFVSITAFPQQAHSVNDKKFFVYVSGGPSFPVGSFASKDLNNEQAGFASTGVSANVDFGYKLSDYMFIISSVVYAKHKIKNPVDETLQGNLSFDHWQYYGIMAGPGFSWPISKKVIADFKFLIGVTNVNSPLVTYNDNVIMNEQWSAAFAMQIGTDLRYFLTDHLFLVAQVNYNAMRPSFKIIDPTNNSSSKASQQISDIPVCAGIGIRF